ncbi:MAG: DUF6552 family protein [Betaproteobacteria bacterium]
MFNTILKWTACAVTLVAALLTSFEVLTYNRELFAVGAALYLLWSVRIREANLIVINGALLAIYAVGIAVK